ncbi:hypothetical protein [Malacoplasma muris]
MRCSDNRIIRNKKYANTIEINKHYLDRKAQIYKELELLKNKK